MTLYDLCPPDAVPNECVEVELTFSTLNNGEKGIFIDLSVEELERNIEKGE